MSKFCYRTAWLFGTAQYIDIDIDNDLYRLDIVNTFLGVIEGILLFEQSISGGKE